MFKLSFIYENKIKLIGGNFNDYNKEYNNETGKFNITINNNQYYYNKSYIQHQLYSSNKLLYM